MMAARYRLDGLINLGNRLKDARQMVHGLLEEIPATSPLAGC